MGIVLPFIAPPRWTDERYIEEARAQQLLPRTPWKSKHQLEVEQEAAKEGPKESSVFGKVMRHHERDKFTKTSHLKPYPPGVLVDVEPVPFEYTLENIGSVDMSKGEGIEYLDGHEMTSPVWKKNRLLPFEHLRTLNGVEVVQEFVNNLFGLGEALKDITGKPEHNFLNSGVYFALKFDVPNEPNELTLGGPSSLETEEQRYVRITQYMLDSKSAHRYRNSDTTADEAAGEILKNYHAEWVKKNADENSIHSVTPIYLLAHFLGGGYQVETFLIDEKANAYSVKLFSVDTGWAYDFKVQLNALLIEGSIPQGH